MKKLLSLSAAVSFLIPFALTAAPVANDANAKKPVVPVAPAANTAVKPAAPVAAKPAVAAKPVAKPAAKPAVAAKPVAKPVAKPAAKPVAKTAAKPAAKPAVAAKPAAKPVAKPVAAPAKPVAKPAAKPVAKPVAAAKPAPAPAPVAKPAPAPEKKFVVPAPAPADPAFTTNEAVNLPEKPAPRQVKYRKNVPIKFVMITSNYPTARFLADQAREKANCTIIIVPEGLPFPERGTLLTVIPARADDAFSIRAEHLSRFLAYLRPLNIIMLGNDKVLPPFYRPAIPSTSNVINVTDTAWHVNAQILDNLFNTNQSLYKSYSRYNYQKKLQREQAKEQAARRAGEKAAAAIRAEKDGE